MFFFSFSISVVTSWHGKTVWRHLMYSIVFCPANQYNKQCHNVHYHSFIPFTQVWGSMQTVDCLPQVYVNLHNCFATNEVWFGLKYAFRFSCNMSTEVIVFPNSIVNRSSQYRNCRFCTVVLRRLMLFAYCMNITVMLGILQ